MGNKQLKGPTGPNAIAKRHFAFPHEVADDPSLSLDEKRAILSEWASDACAVESFPILRWLPGTSFPVTFSAVMDAREWLDRRGGKSDSASGAAVSGCIVVADFVRKRNMRSGPKQSSADSAHN